MLDASPPESSIHQSAFSMVGGAHPTESALPMCESLLRHGHRSYATAVPMAWSNIVLTGAATPARGVSMVHSRIRQSTRPSANVPISKAIILVLLAGMMLVSSGCAHLVSSATDDLAASLSNAILEQDDPAIVEAGAPAYLLLIDGLIDRDPDNEGLLLAGAKLYASYATVFVQDADRAKRLTRKARSYAVRALCQRRAAACEVHDGSYEEYVAFLDATGPSDVSVLYTFGVTWAGWIQAHRDDWNAVADVPKVKATMQRVLALDETHERGGAHLYLGVLAILLPPALGGTPEEARMHFERAIELSEGRNLMVNVMFAESYGRTLFDRDLHDRLLRGVIAAEPEERGLTLMNTLAQERARELLESADQYF